MSKVFLIFFVNFIKIIRNTFAEIPKFTEREVPYIVELYINITYKKMEETWLTIHQDC